MILVRDARATGPTTLWIRFDDGTQGEVDLADQLFGVVFEPLKDASFFKLAYVHPELHTVTWPNGADFAPEFLHGRIRVHA